VHDFTWHRCLLASSFPAMSLSVFTPPGRVKLIRRFPDAGPTGYFRTRDRISTSGHVAFPDRPAPQPNEHAGGVLFQPGMWWWARSYTRRVTGEEATAQARQQLSLMLAGLAGIGVPSAAISEVLARCRPWRKPLAGYQFDEIILACPARQVSAI